MNGDRFAVTSIMAFVLDTDRAGLEPRDLGDGLVLRWTTAADAEPAGTLAAAIFRPSLEDPPNPRQIPRTRDLASGRHPLSGPRHGIVVEDTRAGRLVATMWLIPTTWRYDDVAFGIGRPEQVACVPAYRRRGLVRALFEAFHRRSAAEGQLVQAITGIPYFYRQFGYEYALTRDRGRLVRCDAVAPPGDGEAEAFRLRDATPSDVPFITALYERSRQGLLVTAEMPAAYWRWTLFEADKESGRTREAAIVVDATGERRGYIAYSARRHDGALEVEQVALVDGVSLFGVLGPVLRGLRARAAPAGRLNFNLGPAHPLYEVLGPKLVDHVERPYAWYVRVPEVPAFLGHVQPALERSLAASAAASYSGEVRIDCYRYGLRLVFEEGRIAAIEPWERAIRPHSGPRPGAAFPPPVFLQLIFGYRSLEELVETYADAWADGDASVVLKALFPKRPSNALELD